jgi:hypothetical protein
MHDTFLTVNNSLNFVEPIKIFIIVFFYQQLLLLNHTQIDQNGVVYDLKTGRKCYKSGAFMAVFRVYTVCIIPYYRTQKYVP